MALYNSILNKTKVKSKLNNSLYDDSIYDNNNALYQGIVEKSNPTTEVNKVQATQPTFKGFETDGAETESESGDNTVGDIFNLGATAYGSFNGGSGGPGWIGAAQGGMNGLNRFAESGDWKDTYEGFFGYDSEEDSDVMQAIKGTVNGASTGAGIGGPWGALIGGVLGLGSSFIDDF